MKVEDENGRSPGPGLKMLEPGLEIFGGSVTSWRWLPGSPSMGTAAESGLNVLALKRYLCLMLIR